ncbi:hypothetical protein [Phyllobacterium endophyticum]|uniref:Uncharacterized protein n=1 Tax=Phyllobacterium endophyticum TaxID=1149773 RepID=A0A2P7AS03_9HYPH|nr:hypothetical protein [Phyllobacterium endophyticum]MBB3236708.1 hypothetical protein [Phyllobacterium endophyticum]PSH56998.1 hypothetical protein CU100_17080 [Phyllobacterium endophyticum]TYR39687.1 hypothetical protein FY050_21715 [Phyllobacterium endophyticum]
MANGSSASVFYREVDDAIARNPPNVSDLVVLKGLCEAVELGERSAVARLTRDLVKLSGFEDPLHAISYELFHSLMARILLSGWFEEFQLLVNWPQTLFGDKNRRVAGNWDGIVTIVKKQPRSLGLLTLPNREKEWQRALNGLEGAMRHFEKADLPPAPRMGAPPEGPSFHERVLPEQLLEAIEQFYRVLQMLFQQLLEFAVAKLEQDSNDASGLRKLQDLQLSLWRLLSPKDLPRDVKAGKIYDEMERQNDRRTMILNKVIRITEFHYGRGRAKLHRFLDAFEPHNARSVIFNSLDREDTHEPHVRGERIGNIQVSRDRQLAYLLITYGHAWEPNRRPAPAHTFRRALINGRHGGRLRLVENDELIAFLYSVFAETLIEFTRQAQTAADKSKAGVNAWRETVETASVYFGQVTTHSRLNLTEGPPNYLTHTFPRNLIGRLLHDCGVHSVKSAYVLLSVLNRINGAHVELAGQIRARWVRLPLHVGMVIQTSNFGVVVQHNEYSSVTDNDELKSTMTAWEQASDETDPSNPDDVTIKFLEDLTANGFSSDLDMPISSIPILKPGEPVTTHTIWNSYQQKVVPSQLFTRLVGASNAPQYQFDVRYLQLSELEREWYNRHVLRFWNKECLAIWEEWAAVLTSTKVSDKDYEKHKRAYMKALNEALDRVEESYEKQILPKKNELSSALRGEPKLLVPGIRIVSASRLETVLPAVEKVADHLNDISQLNFRLSPDFIPLFARKEEVLLEVP